jgi:hypothetical protein
VGALIADGTDDGAFDTAHDVRLVAEFPDFLEHGGFLFFGDLGFEDNDHIFCGVARSVLQAWAKKEPQAFDLRLR